MEDSLLLHSQGEQFSASGLFFNEQGVGSYYDKASSEILDHIKDDHQLLFDWQNHVDAIHDSFNDSMDIEYNFDLKTEPPDIECPILSTALTSFPTEKPEPEVKRPVEGEKILFLGDVEPLRVSSSIQTDSVLRRITQARSVLINGERDILGKNIIGLHSLNELKTSPDEKCQITSTVINGKRYKVIIRPKSSTRSIQQAAKTDGCIEAVGNAKNDQSDELISELQNGDYDVLGNDDKLDLWQLSLGESAEVDVEENLETEPQVTPLPDPLRVPPLRIKIPKKLKKHKNRKDSISRGNSVVGVTSENETNVREIRERINGKRPSLLQAVPRRTDVRGGTRLQEAARAISRNKLLSIVTGGDSVQLDHDYCSYILRQESPSSPNDQSPRQRSQSPSRKLQLVEKNPRKDSGLESGGVSDASEECQTPDPPRAPPVLAPQLASKLLEEQRRSKNHLHVTKMAAAIFRAANAITSGQRITDANVQSLDSSDCDLKNPSVNSELGTSGNEPTPEKPKKKLKLEEYRSRRGDKDKEPSASSDNLCDDVEKDNSPLVTNDAMERCQNEHPESEDHVLSNELKHEASDEHEEPAVTKSDAIVPVKVEVPVKQEFECDIKEGMSEENLVSLEEGSRKRAYYRSRRSSSSSCSGERSKRRRTSVGRRGRSGSRERRRSCWSPSRRSSSRDSSSSASDSPACRRSYRYRRRTRSRSGSRGRTHNRFHVNRRRPCNSYRRHSVTSRRSRSPIYTHREKQKQIEERRVIYVGRIAEGTTNNHLRMRFSLFGPINDISVHFREHGDNYGFVTFAYKEDAYEAVEHGNDDPNLPEYDLCFGGRRTFCKQRYSDLDGMPTSYSGFKDNPVVRPHHDSFNFDLLLKEAKDKLRLRKEKT